MSCGNLVIRNARVVLPNCITPQPIDVWIQNGKIASLGALPSAVYNVPCLDAGGDILLAGFIDLHVHGGGGSDFMDGDADAFRTVAQTHLQHGTTALLPTSMTATETELKNFIDGYRAFTAYAPQETKMLGLHLEGPYLSGAGGKAKGAQRGELLRLPDLAEAERLLTYANGAIKRWDIAPELPNAIYLAKYLHARGIICSQAHSAATAAESLLGFTNGFSHVTHFYNAVTTYHKADQKVLAGIVEAAYLCDHVSIELICDGRHIPKEIVQLALKIKGPCAVSAITDAMRLAGTTEKEGILGNRYSGTPVIVDDDVAKLPDLSSYAGSICTMDRCLRVLCCDYEIPLPTASVLLSYAPAKLLGLHTYLGRIAVGYTADLTLVDSDYHVRHVITDGIVRL